MWKSNLISILSILTGTARAIPQHSRNSPEGLQKSMSIGSRGMLLMNVSMRNSDMMQAWQWTHEGLLQNFPYRAIEGRGRWANSNWLGGAFHFLRPFFIYGFAGKIKGCCRSPIMKAIRDVPKVFIRIILELERELWRLNFFFLWCSRFGRGLNIQILECGRVGFGWLGALKVRLGLLLGLVRISNKRRVS
jgi:hypothetical protein